MWGRGGEMAGEEEMGGKGRCEKEWPSVLGVASAGVTYTIYGA